MTLNMTTTTPAPVATTTVDSAMPATAHEFDTFFARCAHEARSLERAYVRAVQTGKVSSIQNARWRYLRSLAVRVDAARRANNKLPRNRQVADENLFMVAAMIQWGKPILEPARLWGKPKSAGGERPILDFGIIRRAACEAVRFILMTHHTPRPFQHDGVHRAVRRIRDHIEQGHEYVTQLDINNHYGSHDVDQLHNLLPLSKGVIDHVVAARHIPVVASRGRPLSRSLIDEARRGIPQGSPISPLVAMIVTSQLTWEDGPNAVMVNYADNFCVMSKSQHQADSATDALAAAIAVVPGGLFSTKREKTVHASEEFGFLGHRFKKVAGKLIVSPSAKNTNRYDKRMKEYDELAAAHLYKPGGRPSCHDRMVAYTAVADMWVFARSWAGVFQECPSATEDLQIARQLVEEYVAKLGVTFDELNGYSNPDAEWDGDGYEG